LENLAGNRFKARWEMAGVMPSIGALPTPASPLVTLTPPSEYSNLIENYRNTGVNFGCHPLALLREQRQLGRSVSAADLTQLRHDQWAQVCGLIVGRQRPRSATDVTFVTLEDEAGSVNVVVWSATAKQQRQPLNSATLLHVKGIIEREVNVIHLIAGQLSDWSHKLNQLLVKSRDFR
jgi:error-prone DNA polymerase